MLRLQMDSCTLVYTTKNRIIRCDQMHLATCADIEPNFEIGQGSISGSLIHDPGCHARFSHQGLSDDETSNVWLQSGNIAPV